MDMESRNLLVELLVEELPPKALARLGDAFARELFEQFRFMIRQTFWQCGCRFNILDRCWRRFVFRLAALASDQ